MNSHGNDLLDLHPVAVTAAVLGGRPQQAASRDAEPAEPVERRPGLAGRLLTGLRGSRGPAPSPETARA